MTLLAIAADMSQYIFIEIQVSYKKCMSNISKWYEQQKSKIKYFFIKTITEKNMNKKKVQVNNTICSKFCKCRSTVFDEKSGFHIN